MATSMVTPKVNNDHLFLGKTRISPTRNLFVQRSHETHGLDQNNMNFESFLVTRTSSSTLTDERYSAGRILSNSNSCTNLTLYTLSIVRLTGILRYSEPEKLIFSMQKEELKSSFQNSDQRVTINMTFLILDVCMQNTLYIAGSRHVNFELFT